MSGYTTREVAEILDLSESQVRVYARSDLLSTIRGDRNEFRFSFHDIILMRTMGELLESGLSPQKVKRALRSLREQLPQGQPLSAVRISADADSVIVHDEDTVWNPQTGQLHLDFAIKELADKVAPFATKVIDQRSGSDDLDADGWCDLAVDLEPVAPERAVEAYGRALRLDPGHVISHLNLGRRLHEGGDLAQAESHYRQAQAADPDSPTAAFNLGVVLEDLGRVDESIDGYLRALQLEPDMSAAHFNLAHLYERTGRDTEAIRHLADYKRLREGGG